MFVSTLVAMMTMHEPVPEYAQREQSKQNPIAGDMGAVFKEQQETANSSKKA